MPRVQTTRTVKVALGFLPVYLVIMMSLIIIKFVSSCTAANHAGGHGAAATNIGPAGSEPHP